MPLEVTASKGDVQIMRMLIEGGTNVMHSTDCFGMNTVLKRSIENGRTEMVSFLLDIGQVEKNRLDTSYLELACDGGHQSAVRLLLENGANVNDCITDSSKMRKTASLHKAAMQGFAAIAEILISFGAKVNATNHQRDIALHLACSHRPFDADTANDRDYEKTAAMLIAIRIRCEHNQC